MTWNKRGIAVVANSRSIQLGHETLSHERLDEALDKLGTPTGEPNV